MSSRLPFSNDKVYSQVSFTSPTVTAEGSGRKYAPANERAGAEEQPVKIKNVKARAIALNFIPCFFMLKFLLTVFRFFAEKALNLYRDKHILT